MLRKGIIAVYARNHTKYVHILYGKSVDLMNSKLGGACKLLIPNT